MERIPVVSLKSASHPEREIVNAFRTHGFSYIEDHGVSVEVQKSLETAAQEFFSRPVAEKMQYEMKNSGRAWRGYFPPGGELTSGRPDQKEGFYFGVDYSPGHPEVIRKTPIFGVNPWPNTALKIAVTDYMREMKKLSFRVMELISLGLGLKSDFFAAAFGGEPTELFRIFGYPKHEFVPEDDEWGVREHTDMGFLTILKQDDSGGLEVRGLSGDWMQAPPRNNTFVLNIGDMLEFWTGGVLRSTPHRVRNPANKERFSYPYFFDPNWFTSLKPIDPKLIAHFPKSQRVMKRWDGLELHALGENSTYGEFVWQKISGVFPGLTGPE